MLSSVCLFPPKCMKSRYWAEGGKWTSAISFSISSSVIVFVDLVTPRDSFFTVIHAMNMRWVSHMHVETDDWNTWLKHKNRKRDDWTTWNSSGTPFDCYIHKVWSCMTAKTDRKNPLLAQISGTTIAPRTTRTPLSRIKNQESRIQPVHQYMNIIWGGKYPKSSWSTSRDLQNTHRNARNSKKLTKLFKTIQKLNCTDASRKAYMARYCVNMAPCNETGSMHVYWVKVQCKAQAVP